MRITGGKLRGRVLTTKVQSGVRPTSARVREALFSMVGQHLDGVTFLDAFGGSGLITFEAISRGATVTTLERNRSAVKQIQMEAQRMQVRIDLRVCDARTALSTGSWDVVFMDPPYADDPIDWARVGCAAAKSTLVIEHRTGSSMPDAFGLLALDRSRRHGDSVLTIYRRRDAARAEE